MFRIAQASLLVVAAALGASACAGDGAAPPARATAATAASAALAAAPTPRAPVVLALVIDQFSAWMADERVPKLPDDGFFARMTREGTWVHTVRYPYAITDTAPGHTALHTGKVPAESHIVVNEIPDLKTGARTSFFRDPTTRLVTPTGVKDVPGSSSRTLAVDTVADRLRAAHPRAHIVSISLKDRAALLPAGKHPDHALWFDIGEGSFVTGTSVEPTFPSWARADGDASAITKAREGTWEPLDRAWLVANAGADDAPGEGDLDGLGTTFPHRVPDARAFRATPMSDGRILALALAAAKAERNPAEPFLLLVSLSAADVIGHVFGPSSWEAWDQFRRLDASLASFLTALETEVGPVRVLLSGDHGNSAMPEARLPLPAACATKTMPPDPFDRPFCTPGHRIEPDQLRTELRALCTTELGTADLVTGVADGYVFLSPSGRALTGEKRKTLDRIVRRVLTVGHAADVEAVYDTTELATQCPGVLAKARGIPDRARPGEDIVTLVCRSWIPDAGAGDYFVVPRHGSFFDGEVVPGKGASHGTPWLYDRTVPMFLRAPGAIDAGAVVLDPVDFSAYAALETAFIGLSRQAPREILEERTAR